MEINFLTKDLEKDYTYFVNNHPNNLIYYSLSYRTLISKLLDCVPIYLIALENGKIQGVFPFMVKDGPLGKILNSLPYFGSHGGILCTSDRAKIALENFFYCYVKENKFSSITIIQNLFEKDNQFKKIDFSEYDNRIGQIKFFDCKYDNFEDLLKTFHYKTRNMVRKAIKSDVKVRIDNSQIEFLSKYHNINMDSIGGLTKSNKFFELLPKLFESGKHYNIYTAEKDGKLISALLLFYNGEVVEYYMPVIVKEFRALQPLSLIIAKAMFDSSQSNYLKWNWGGTWNNQDGVYRFKSRWGTVDIPYNYKVLIQNKKLYDTSKDKLLMDYKGFYTVPFEKLKG